MKKLSGISALACALFAVIHAFSPPEAPRSAAEAKDICDKQLVAELKKHNLPFNGALSYNPETKKCNYKYQAGADVKPHEWEPQLK